MERYEAVIEANEIGPEAAEAAGRELEKAIGKSARDIRDRYLHPPATTDFAIMFLPGHRAKLAYKRSTGKVADEHWR